MNTSAHHKARRGLRAGTADAGGLGLCMSHHKKHGQRPPGAGVLGTPLPHKLLDTRHFWRAEQRPPEHRLDDDELTKVKLLFEGRC
jgi:hypothetical protein